MKLFEKQKYLNYTKKYTVCTEILKATSDRSCGHSHYYLFLKNSEYTGDYKSWAEFMDMVDDMEHYIRERNLGGLRKW